MLARSSFVALALLTAGCLKDLTEVETSGGSETTTDNTTTTDTTATTSTTDKPTCGDGMLDPGEQCDDGNLIAGDGCEDDCTTTPGVDCGNGMVDSGEECDDGNDVAMDGCENNCTETVVSASCGDGEVNGDDECDDGNDVNTDACTNTCKNATCGDGVVQDGAEQCDDGNDVDTDDCLNSCVPASCGDGVLHTDVETCDNGGDNDDDAYDGCTTQCLPGPRCGDSVLQEPQEQCDDGTPGGDDLCNACTETPRRYIFVTEKSYTGKLGGVAGASSRCGVAAVDANLGALNATWAAWLSDNTAPAVLQMDTAYTGWYALPGNPPVLVAKGWQNLSSGMLLNPINRTETGMQVAPDATVWSNTTIDGAIADAIKHCAKWNSDTNANSGGIGDTNAVDSQWTSKQDPASATCDTQHRLYCVEN